MKLDLPVYYPKNDLGICFTSTGFLLRTKFKEVRKRYWSQFGKTQNVFMWQYSTLHTPHDHKVFRTELEKFNKTYPNVNIIICANDTISFDCVNNLGIDNISAILCNHNATIDRNRFVIDESTQKVWNSVYTATLRPCKRHFLSYHLSNICYLTNGQCGPNGKSDTYDDLHQNQKNNFTLAHQPMKCRDMPIFYNLSKVGLCLSKKEGAMFSSIEYLLCGLPVVSTKNTGGRDEFFTDKNCIFAEDNPESVKDCVNKWLNNYPSLKERYEIREDAILMQKTHTKVLKNKVKEIAEKQGVRIDVDEWYKNIYINKLFEWIEVR